MKISFQKTFLKDLAKIPPKTRLKLEKFVFHDVPVADTFESLNKFEKMKGYQSYYKVRFGNYRIGVKIENEKILFCRLLHRKEIYRYFP